MMFLNKDDKNNSDLKNTTFIESQNNILFTKKNTYAIGINDVAVIESDDKILVSHKKKLDNLKDYLPILSKDNKKKKIKILDLGVGMKH